MLMSPSRSRFHIRSRSESYLPNQMVPDRSLALLTHLFDPDGRRENGICHWKRDVETRHEFLMSDADLSIGAGGRVK